MDINHKTITKKRDSLGVALSIIFVLFCLILFRSTKVLASSPARLCRVRVQEGRTSA